MSEWLVEQWFDDDDAKLSGPGWYSLRFFDTKEQAQDYVDRQNDGGKYRITYEGHEIWKAPAVTEAPYIENTANLWRR